MIFSQRPYMPMLPLSIFTVCFLGLTSARSRPSCRGKLQAFSGEIPPFTLAANVFIYDYNKNKEGNVRVYTE